LSGADSIGNALLCYNLQTYYLTHKPMNPSITPETVINALNWRYATKIFDASLKIDDAKFETLTEALRLSASSFGLQAWKFVVVENHDIRNELRKAGYDQAQFTNASHLIVLCRAKIDEALVDNFMASIAETRKIMPSGLDGYKKVIMGSLSSRSADEVNNWAARQVYIALGTLLETAALLGVDACPMEGFDNAKFDEILKLGEKGLSSVVCCALGYRSALDEAAKNPKVRFPRADVIVKI